MFLKGIQLTEADFLQKKYRIMVQPLDHETLFKIETFILKSINFSVGIVNFERSLTTPIELFLRYFEPIEAAYNK